MRNSLKFHHLFNLKVVIPSATTLGSKKIPISLPANFMEVIAFGTIPVTDGGDPNYAVGLKVGQKTIFEPVHNKRHAISDSVASKDRLLPINFTVQKNEQFNLMIDLNNTLTSDLTLYLELTLLDRASYTVNTKIEHPHSGPDGAEVINNSQDALTPFDYGK
ncbi:MAG: hypothetical protein ACI8ZM_002475 [Crocinitomix sp.]|jgi:hypothetical protein